MALPHYHIARVRKPEDYRKFRRSEDCFGKGINVMFGINKQEREEIQAIFFDATRYDFSEVSDILSYYDIKPIAVESATQENATLNENEYYKACEIFNVVNKTDRKWKVIKK